LLKIRDVLLSEPNNCDLRFQIACWMMAHGRKEEGVDWARTALTIDPEHAATNALLAEHYRKQPGDMGLANYYALKAGHSPRVSGP
jgi:hypothetical protein